MLIPRDIAPDEDCIRCVMPSKMRGGVVRQDAFLPFEHERGSSVLRLRYTTLNYCVDYGKTLDKEKHQLGALLKFNQNDVDQVNAWAQTEASKVKNEDTGEERINGTSAQLMYTPMDGDDYVDPNKEYYTDSCISKPMHADLTFAEPMEKGYVRTRMRHYNNELIKLCKKAFMNKDNDELGEWTDVNKASPN